MPGIFVTGTDTGVGKTQIAAAIARLLTNAGIAVYPRKPVESGCTLDEHGLTPQDALTLKTAANSPQSLKQICPYQFQPAISPERAAAQAGVHISLKDIKSACLNGLNPDNFSLVEGAGGFYSPLARKVRCIDLAMRLEYPVVLVVADRLGCINHTLLTQHAIQSAGLSLIAVIINRMTDHTDTNMDNAADLRQWVDCPMIDIQYQSNTSNAWETIAEHSTQLKNFVETEIIKKIVPIQ